MGVDEQVLVDLQTVRVASLPACAINAGAGQIWEQKLVDSRVINPLDFPMTVNREDGHGGASSFFYPTATGGGRAAQLHAPPNGHHARAGTQ